MRKYLVASIAILLVVNCVVFGGAAYFIFGQSRAPSTQPARTVAFQLPPLSPTVLRAAQRELLPQVTPTPVSDDALPLASSSAESTLDQLVNLNPPSNNKVRLVEEFEGSVPILATPSAPHQYRVGDKETFWISRNIETSSREQVQATLRYMNAVVYMWVEDGVQVSDSALKQSADVFADSIYPTDRKYLGSEATPGIDNDVHLHILNADFNGASGYYSSPDTLPRSVNRQSNEHEMIYISTRSLQPGSNLYDSVLAHEFAHMIHDNQNRRGESTWITEGFGDLGMELNGYKAGHEGIFAQDPDIQLTSWGTTPGASLAHYGAAYLFLSYQLQRFGVDYIRALISTSTTGIATIEHALNEFAPGTTFDNVFGDWAVANFISGETRDPRYTYLRDPLGLRPTVGYSHYPASGSDTVHQYGADYILLNPANQDVTFTFEGSNTVRVLPTNPHSGKYFWWSDNVDLSESSLTRAFDLSTVNHATLQFWTWYDIEADYDYGYVAVSTDDGKTWKTIRGTTTTNSDPNAVSFGNAFTCKSGASCTDSNSNPQWIQEQMDLSQFAGKKILVRFLQLTDQAVTLNGMAVDDIEIPEIGFYDNAESDANSWNAQGWARIDNILPQRFIVKAIEFGATPRVVPITLDAQNRGSYTTSGLGKDVSHVVIVVAGSTPITRQIAQYSYQIR